MATQEQEDLKRVWEIIRLLNAQVNDLIDVCKAHSAILNKIVPVEQGQMESPGTPAGEGDGSITPAPGA